MELLAKKAIDISTASSPYSVQLTSDCQSYTFTGTKALSAPFTIQAVGTASEGMRVWFLFNTSITTSGGTHVFTIFGTPIYDVIATTKWWAMAEYLNGAWFVISGAASASNPDGTKIDLDTRGALTIKPASIVNADIDAAAAITYTKLTLANSILNADISPSAAIAYSKLSLTNSIANADISSSAAIAYSKLNLASSILNSDIGASAAIAYSKLTLTNSVTNADIAAAAAIAYTKLSLTNSIVDADVKTSAAISRSKLAALTANRVTVADASGVDISSSITTTELGYLAGATSNLQAQINAVVPNSVTRATLSGTTILTFPMRTMYFCDVSGGGFTVTLPAASTVTADTKVEFVVWGHNTNVLTITRAGSDLIDAAASIGGTSLTSSGYDAGYILICDGSTKWTAITR